MKRGKRLLILLAIVAVFGVGAYLLNLNAKQQEAAKTASTEAAKTTLINATEDNAAKLSFTHDGQAIDLAKENGAWVYEPRESFALNTSKVTELFTGLKDVESVRTVENASTDTSEYGLEEPAVAITVTNTDGTTQKISIGDKNSVTGNYYVAVDGKPGVYTISEDLYNTFNVGLMDLLTPESYPTIEADSVTGVEWSNGDETTLLTHKPDGDPSTYSSNFKWFENGEDGKTLMPVNADAVDTFLKAATGITYDSTVSDNKDELATYGLDQPSLSVTLHYTENVPQSQAADELAKEAASATATPQATVSATPLATDTPAVTNAVEGTATPTSAPTATSTATAAVTSTPTATTMPTATTVPAATMSPTATATSAISGGLGNAMAEDASAVPTETPTAAPTATPEPTIAIQRSITLWFGKTDENGKVYMTHSKTDRVFLVSADTLATLQKLTDSDLRNNIPANIARADLTGMVSTANGVTKTVSASNQTSTSKDGNVTTTVVYQIDGKELKSTLFSMFINDLNEIKAEGYTDKPVADGATPLLTAKLTQNRTGFETVDVAFYTYDENFDQALVNGDATMLVNKRDVEQLITYFDGLVATEATPTPEVTATPTPAQ